MRRQNLIKNRQMLSECLCEIDKNKKAHTQTHTRERAKMEQNAENARASLKRFKNT